MDLTTQYISDNQGNIVSAIIPIEAYKHFLEIIIDSNIKIHLFQNGTFKLSKKD
ncbi:MAG: hypothetical protein KDC55_02960 [Ignavibacteriae bacterium]|nr:hypothetical protein [Ignavibacteriota bacterium]